MVQPLPSVAAAHRSDVSAPQPPRRPITHRNYDEFSVHMNRAGLPRGRPQEAVGTPEIAAPQTTPTAKEMSPGVEASPSLAPEDQPSLGPGGGEVAEWFSLFNPGGGLDAPAAAPPATMPPAAVVEIADLVERWVRRVAMGGDQRRGAVRLDIGQGRFSGAQVLVIAEAGHVSVELQLPASLVEGDLSQRLRSRLERRGYAADVVVR